VDYLVCDDPEMVKHMVSYFYNPTYSCSNTEPTDGTDRLDNSTTYNYQAEILTHAKMFAIAVKYQVNGLREYAAKCFGYAARRTWWSEEFLETFTIVFNSTPEQARELRDIVFDTVWDHWGDFKDRDEVKEAFDSHPFLVRELLDRQWDPRSYVERIVQTKTTESECTVCHFYKDESELASGLPKMCRECDNGDWLWY
jgi:hypothetical protein